MRPVWCPITAAFIYLNKISWLVFRKETDCVFCEVKLKNNQVFKDAPSTSDFPSESPHHCPIFLLLWTLRVFVSEEQMREGWETFQESNAIPRIGEHFIRIVQYAVHYCKVSVQHKTHNFTAPSQHECTEWGLQVPTVVHVFWCNTA